MHAVLTNQVPVFLHFNGNGLIQHTLNKNNTKYKRLFKIHSFNHVLEAR